MARVSAAVITAALATVLTITPLFEGTVKKVYRDPVGIPTACTGHTGSDVRMGTVYTSAQCYAYLTADEKAAMTAVLDLTTGPINPNELAALTDFTFNVGRGNFAGSTLRKLFNEGNHIAACKELLKWTLAKGKQLPGLVIRRNKEEALCLS